LLSLQIKEPLKALEKTLKTLQPVAAQAAACKLPISSAEGLIQTVINAALDSIIAGCEPPKVAKDFDNIVAQARAKTSLLAQEWARRVQAIVLEAAATYKKLGTIKAHPTALAALQAQYERLFHKTFLDEAFERLGHYPRYLQAMALRCDKLRTDPARDTRLMSELAPLWTQYTRAKAARKGQVDNTLDSIRWLLEELHVGLFAQELKTPTPVSIKRVSKAFEGLER
jgi:ATP-dependent helicase HrpA